MTSRRMLILSYTIQQPNVCTNFQNPRSYSSREIFDTNLPVLYLSDRLKKETMEKDGQKNDSFLVFFYTIEFNLL